MPKKTDPSQKNKESVIFEAALHTIKQKGFHKARMSDIAKNAGVSYGLLYHYFKGKEDLFDTIMGQLWRDDLFRLMCDINRDEYDTHKKPRSIIDHFLDTYQDNPEPVTIFITEISESTTKLTGDRLDRFKKFMSLPGEVSSKGQADPFSHYQPPRRG